MVHRSRSGASDASLVAATLEGDNGAYAELVSRYQRLVYGMAYAWLLDDQDTEDLARQAFLSAYAKLAHLDDAQRFRSWLAHIAGNQSRLASLRRQVEARLAGIGSVTGGPVQVETPASHGKPSLRAAFENLSEVQRVTATLYLMGGYTQEEVASFLGIPPGTVASRLHEVRETLPRETSDSLVAALKDKVLRFEFTASVMSEISHLWRHSFQGEEEEETSAFNRLASYLHAHSSEALSDEDGVFVECIDGRLVGFALASEESGPRLWSIREDVTGHIAALHVLPRYRRRGIGSSLLRRIEEHLRQKGCTRMAVRARQGMPEFERIRWGENLPVEAGFSTSRWGVDLSSPAYPFFLNRGYQPSGQHVVFSWDIERHRIPEAVNGYRKNLEAEGLKFKVASSRDLEDIFACAESAGDSGSLLRRGNDFDPASVVVCRNTEGVVGYVGPSYVYEDGRAESIHVYVRPEARNRRIATVLIHWACNRLCASGGVDYRYTAGLITNPASPETGFQRSKSLGFRVKYCIDPALWRRLA